MANGLENQLGSFLKDRRAKIDPASLGIAARRRRTPGLRREEVAQRAQVSATWYTWLEQGRGGAPSAGVLERVAQALLLTAAEREHLFLLAQRRQPEIRSHQPATVTPRLQRILDTLTFSPAYVKTPSWDVVAWNRAAAAVLTDYGKLDPSRRNILRMLFAPERNRLQCSRWREGARMAVATFRLETSRAGLSEQAQALVDELSSHSDDFAELWAEHDVSSHGEGTKYIAHPTAGTIALEYSAFAVDDQPDLGLVIYNPATPEDFERIRVLLAQSGG
jgi:transcriptional regulator with XRE-family HTH domain